MAAPGFAVGVLGVDGGFEAWDITFVEPGCGDGHDVAAVIEHKGMFVGVAEEVEGFHGTVGAGVVFCDEVTGGAEPDESGVALVCLFSDPLHVGFAVLATAGFVAFAVDHPDEGRLFALGQTDFRHAEGGSADEVRPPTIVAVILDTEVFPFPEGGSTGYDEVFGKQGLQWE